MNEQDNKRNMMYERIPEVARLNKVPGFNPLQFLRPVISEKTQERLLKLDLRYQKLWFRLAHPKGKMKLNALRITDQMAIFEAQVFFDRSDNEPASNFIASLTREENLDYIKAAQEKALNTALTDAGFGLQFADISVGREGEDYGCIIPAEDVQAKETSTKAEVPVNAVRAEAELKPVSSGEVSMERAVVQKKPAEIAGEMLPAASKEQQVFHEKQDAPADKLPASLTAKVVQAQSQVVTVAAGAVKAESLPVVPAAENSQTESQGLPVMATTETAKAESLPITPAVEKTPMENLPIASAAKAVPADSLPVSPSAATRQEPSQIAGTTDESQTVPFARPLTAAMATASELPVSANTQKETPAAEAADSIIEQKAEEAAAPRYTADMTVEEIVAVMTYEEARSIKVDKGICNGWTVGDVADKRPPSLKFYVYGNDSNNILRAAAKIMLDSLAGQKAS